MIGHINQFKPETENCLAPLAWNVHNYFRRDAGMHIVNRMRAVHSPSRKVPGTLL